MFVNRGHNSTTRFNSPYLLGAQEVLEVLVSPEDPADKSLLHQNLCFTCLQSNELTGTQEYYIRQEHHELHG